MDVDNELDGKLLQQFSSMGTTDKEVLISEFRKLLGPNEISPAGCAFFLDMNNWNLQAAICSYYDYDQPNIRLPSMGFIMDVTVGEGEAVPPNTTFTKTWRVQNSGDEAWPPGCCLKYCTGDNLSNTDRIMVDMLQPGQISNISVQMHSPPNTGVYQSQWRMSTPTGLFFGDVIWVIVQVDEGGVLDITQQLQKFGSDSLGHSVYPQNIPNPFASPVKQDCNGINPPNVSPNSSILAQHGSPSSPELLVSPISSLQIQHSSPLPSQLSPFSGQNQSTARSLFQTPTDIDCDIQEGCKSDLDLS